MRTREKPLITMAEAVQRDALRASVPAWQHRVWWLLVVLIGVSVGVLLVVVLWFIIAFSTGQSPAELFSPVMEATGSIEVITHG